MASEKTGSPFEAMTAPFQAMTQGMDSGQFGEIMKANAEAGRKWMEGFGRISHELMTFSSNRMQEDMRTMQRLASCSDPSEAVQLQSECLNTMIKEYMDEAQRICEIASDTGAGCLGSIDTGVRAAAEGASKSSGGSGSKQQAAE